MSDTILTDELTGMIVDMPDTYDFEFIMQSIAGLLPIKEEMSALNPAMIVSIDRAQDLSATISMHNGTKYNLSHLEMIEFEQMIRRRLEDDKTRRFEAMKDQIRMQVQAAAEINGQVAPGRIEPPWPTRGRGGRR